MTAMAQTLIICMMLLLMARMALQATLRHQDVLIAREHTRQLELDSKQLTIQALMQHKLDNVIAVDQQENARQWRTNALGRAEYIVHNFISKWG